MFAASLCKKILEFKVEISISVFFLKKEKVEVALYKYHPRFAIKLVDSPTTDR